MYIIHAAYTKNSFFLWGEQSFDTFKQKTGRKPSLPPLPWGAKAEELLPLLKEAGVHHRRKPQANDTSECKVTLPSYGGIPVVSSPLLGELPPRQGKMELRQYKVEGIKVSPEDLGSIMRLVGSSGEKLPIPGLLFANDAKFVFKALEYASLLAIRGSFIPYMELTGDGKCVSLWKPLLLPKYHEEYDAFVGALPPVLKGFSSEGETASSDNLELADAILGALLDSLVRSAQNDGARGRHVDPDNAHEMWIRSLTWRKAPLEKWNDDMKAIYPQIRAWAESAKAGSGEPWRLFLRLEEPAESEEGKNWTLSWHLQSVRDPSLIVPAERVWSPGSAEVLWFSSSDANPRRYLLKMLGQIAPSVPAVAESLEDQCPVSCELNLCDLFEFMHDTVPALIDQGIQIQFPASLSSPDNRPKLAVHGKVSDASSFSAGGQVSLDDLLQVDWSVSLGGEVLSDNELQMLTELKTPLANIRGRWVLLYRDELENIINGMKKLPREVTRRTALLSSLSENANGLEMSGIEGSLWLDSVRGVLTGHTRISDVEQPAGFNGTLRPYQLRGLSWMSWLTHLGLGGCLADDMGLGKTVQALALLRHNMLNGEKRPVLLVCPTSVIENWRREAARFLPDMPTSVHHGTKRLKGEKFARSAAGASLVITSYSLLYRDSSAMSKVDWSGVILDEAQNIKNPDTRQARAARSVKADWRLALTGTPVENHVGDMWSIMEYLIPGLLPNKTRFSREYLRPIQSGQTEAAERMRRITGPFILRRLKTDKNIISDLPRKIESEVFCPLGREQASLYASVLSNLEKGIDEAEGIKRKGMVLAAITSLKQICDHPALYLKDKSELTGRSGKLARLAELAEVMLSAGDRALIFTQYAEMGSLIKQFLQETFGREALFLHGGVPREKRDEMVSRFQSSDESRPPFFILSIKAGGTGLNLTGANHVVLFDRWWNPAVEQQAVDRAYRIGQVKNVQVHYFCCKGTLEEKIENLLQSKKQIANSVVTSGENWFSEMSNDDLRELFSLNRDAVEDI